METLEFLLGQLERLSIIPASWLWVGMVGLLVVNLLLSLLHALQELRGKMWRYVGAITGVRIPDTWGVALFFVGLMLVLVAVGVAATVGLPGLSDNARMFAVGTMIGMRLSDSWFLHYKLERAGYKPNPGLPSAPLYMLEALLLAAVFWNGVTIDPPYSALATLAGLAAGSLFFISVLPIVRLVGKLLPMLRQSEWQPGAPMSMPVSPP